MSAQADLAAPERARAKAPAPAAGRPAAGRSGPAPGTKAGREGRAGGLRGSPLARRIVGFNLLGLLVLLAGILLLNPFRASLLDQQAQELEARALLVAQLLTAGPETVEASTAARLGGIEAGPQAELWLFDAAGAPLAHRPAPAPVAAPEPAPAQGLAATLTGLTDRLAATMDGLAGWLPARRAPAPTDPAALARQAQAAGGPVPGHLVGGGQAVAVPLPPAGQPSAVVVLGSGPAAIEPLLRAGRLQMLQMAVIALLVSLGLSLALAATLANPLAELAAAAEAGQRGRGPDAAPGMARSGERVRLPDLSGRGDEIGRLSRALRSMVAALYDRIDANEQFAADVAHEIKNPLASLGAAVEGLQTVTREDQRARLLAVIETDVRRLDRLVSDIANASRLDSDLVKEEEQPFDLIHMLERLGAHFAAESAARGIEFVTDLPEGPLTITGLEPRLAQVFVNLLENALSFCARGDGIRLWARRRENRVLVVVEDTGPGIPEAALARVFRRFYSDRPAHHFGQNSGLGLAISKQIVEAHGGVIWAENIRPAESAGPAAALPLGARFVVGLPV